MRPIVTDRVAGLSDGQSVYPSVWYTSEPCKNGWTDRDAARTRVGPGNHVLDWIQISMGRGNFWRKGRPL